MKTNLQRQINKLYKKHEDKCSICKKNFSENDTDLVFTCTGFDKLRRLQMTSYCCNHKIVNIINLGLMGYFDTKDYAEIMKKHPMFEDFKKKNKNFLENIEKKLEEASRELDS
jgi:hypothetical protein